LGDPGLDLNEDSEAKSAGRGIIDFSVRREVMIRAYGTREPTSLHEAYCKLSAKKLGVNPPAMGLQGTIDARPLGDHLRTERPDHRDSGDDDEAGNEHIFDDLATLIVPKDLLQSVHDSAHWRLRSWRKPTGPGRIAFVAYRLRAVWFDETSSLLLPAALPPNGEPRPAVTDNPITSSC
jgi:hypothetical protein